MTRRIKLEANETGHGTLTIDGDEVPGVRAVTIRTRAGAATTVYVELIDVEVDADLTTTDDEYKVTRSKP